MKILTEDNRWVEFSDSTKFCALDSLNNLIDNGVTKTKEAWRKWGDKNLNKRDKALGFNTVVGVFHSINNGFYCRINYGAMPVNKFQNVKIK